MKGIRRLGLLLGFTVAFGWIQARAVEPLVFTQVRDSLDVARDSKGVDSQSPLIGRAVPAKIPLLVGLRSRVELSNSRFVVRVGGGSEVQLQPDGGLRVSQGAILIQPVASDFSVNVDTQNAAFSLEGIGCSVVERTSNGGCKLMVISDAVVVVLGNGSKKKLEPGNLMFIVPQKKEFGPVLNIDLLAFRATSALINGFERPLERLKAIRSAAYRQTFRIKSRTNALIGDAKNAENYDVLFFK